MARARSLALIGNFDIGTADRAGARERDGRDFAIVNSINPDRIAGQKTAAFEIVRSNWATRRTIISLPVGNAGNITAYWKGYHEY